MGAAQVSAGNKAGIADERLLRKGLPCQAKGLEKGLRLLTLKVTGTTRDFKLVNESQGAILEASFRYPCGAETGPLRKALCHLSALCSPRFIDGEGSSWPLGSPCFLPDSGVETSPAIPALPVAQTSPAPSSCSSGTGAASSGPLWHGIWRPHASHLKSHARERKWSNVPVSKAIISF